MSKRIVFFSLILFSALMSTSLLGALAPTTAPNLSGQRDNTLNAISRPKSSAGTVTEMWQNDDASSNIKQVVISADGNYTAASYVSSKNVTLFHRDSNSKLWEFEAAGNIDEIAISGNGTYVVASCYGNAYLLNNTEEHPKTVMWEFGGDPYYHHVDISLDGQYIAVGIDGATESLFLLNNSYSQNKKEEWQIDTSKVTELPIDVSISCDGNYTVFGDDSTGNVILVNKTKTTPKIAEWKYDTTSGIIDVEMAQSGEYFIVANNDKEVYLFNTTNYQGIPMWNFTVPSVWGFQGIAISADGKYSIAAFAGHLYYFDNTFSGVTSQKEPFWEFDPGGGFEDIDISGDGKYIVAATDSVSTLYLINSQKATPKVEEWKGYEDEQVNEVSINADGEYFAAGVQLSGPTTYRLSLFHHDISGPSLLPGRGDDDDDDDDDDTGVVVVVVIIIIVSIGGVVFVIIILIKKGMIDITKFKRG